VPQAFSHLALVSAALVLGGRPTGLRRSEASA
jgi:hypothetical protein